MNQQNTTLKKAMVEALEKSLGIVTTACKSVGINRSTHYDWMQDDEDYKKSVLGIDDMTIDFAESHLHKKIKDGDTTATIFYLKTKGKKRGYIERSEQFIESDNVNKNINITKEQLKIIDEHLNNEY